MIFFTSTELWSEVFMTLSIIIAASRSLCCSDQLRAHPAICDAGIIFPWVHYFMFINFEFHLLFYCIIAQSLEVLLQGFTVIAHLCVTSLTRSANFLTFLITPYFRSVICKINTTGLSTAPCRTALVSLSCQSWLCISALCFLSF